MSARTNTDTGQLNQLHQLVAELTRRVDKLEAELAAAQADTGPPPLSLIHI